MNFGIEEARRTMNENKGGPFGAVITDSEGNKVLKDKVSRFGIKERVNAREATSQILRWTQGAIDMESMIEKLQEHAEENPWINQIINRLTTANKTKEEIGADTDFRS